MNKLIFAALALAGVTACNRAEQPADVGNDTEVAMNDVERGRYLATIMDCAGCHNEGAFSPEPQKGYLAGGTVGFEVPGMGIFYPPNLSSHPDAGIGRWSEADIVKALRTGERPDGRVLAPAMPWPAYSKLSDADMRALAAYLKSLPPSPRKVPGPATPANAPAPYMTVKAPGA